MDYRNHSFCLDSFHLFQQQDWTALFTRMDEHDSFEDWPWPLMYEQIDEHYPDARFILTTRATPEHWYKSLCKMAVRMGPLKDFEEPVYGYAMPQGHRQEHLDFYNAHNARVRQYFKDKPGKLLEICFDEGVLMDTLTGFLDQPTLIFTPPHANKSASVYSGDSLWKAHAHRMVFQSRWYTIRWLKQRKQDFKGLLIR